jgi:hypothetical protein
MILLTAWPRHVHFHHLVIVVPLGQDRLILVLAWFWLSEGCAAWKRNGSSVYFSKTYVPL